MEGSDTPGTHDAGRGRPRRLTVRVESLSTLFVWGAALVLFVIFIEAVSRVLLGVLAAACVAAALRPLVWRVPLPRAASRVAVGLVPVVVAALGLWLVIWLLIDPVSAQIEQLPEFRERIDGGLARFSQTLRLAEPLTVQRALDAMGTAFTGSAGGLLSGMRQVVSDLTLGAAFVFFGTLFLLVERRGHLLAAVVEVMPARRAAQLRAAVDAVEPKLRWWVLGTLFNMVVTGVTSWAGYSLVLGVQAAVPLGVLAGLAEIVPTFGPMLGLVVAVLFAASLGWPAVLGVVVVYTVLQTIESNVLMPLVFKSVVNVPPVVTLFTTVLWGLVLGVPGLLLHQPINLVIWSLVTHMASPPAQEREAGGDTSPRPAGAIAPRPGAAPPGGAKAA